MTTSSDIKLASSPWPAVITYGKWLAALCFAPAALMMLGFDFSSPTGGEGESMIHSLLEWTGVCAALIVGLLAFLQYRLTDEPSLPIIGLAVLGAAGMDIFHTLAASGLVASVTDLDSFIPYTWAGSRLFAGLISLCGVGLFIMWKDKRSKMRSVTLFGIAAVFMGSAFFLMDYCATAEGLPRTIYAENLVKKPLDLYPLGIFLLCGGLVFPAYYRHNPTPFALALILSVIPQCATQLYMALGSSGLHDSGFNVAHVMKALAYFVPVSGLLAELYQMFQRERDMRTRFEDARRDAQIATRSKSEFLSAITQEIRTPMTGVLGMTDLLLTSGLSTTQRDAAETISGSAGAVLALVEDVQDFSRLESGSVELEQMLLEPRRLMDGILELLTTQAKQHNVRLSAFVAPEVPNRVLGDAGRLRQILVKLAANALRHTRDGEVNVVLELVEMELTEVVMRFHVRDTGAGMPEDKRVRILRSFSQPGQEDGHEFGGNGLGLAVTRQIVRLMGGSIWVESQLGQGTSFCFTVRLGKDLEDRRGARKVEEWQGKRLLLAASSPMRAEHLQRQLLAWGFQVTTASDGWDALREVRASLLLDTPFDLVLMDDELEGQTGKDLCRQIRASDGGDRLQLLLVSGIDNATPGPVQGEEPWDLRLQSPLRHFGLHNALLEAFGIARSPLFARRAADQETSTEDEEGLQILIAEDDPVNQKVLAKLLERLGCRVDLVDNGHDAVEKVMSGNYDLVFMDCQMPHMDGYEATRVIRMRQAQSGAHSIVIAMTANARLSTRELCLQSGMDDYMAKPIRASLLAETLDRWKAGDVESAMA